MEKDLKELLLKDLCARLPYSTLVYAQNDMDWYESEICTQVLSDVINEDYIVKPYLFPLSSMSDKELIKFLRIKGMNLDSYGLKSFRNGETVIVSTLPLYSRHVDWLNAHHFDYRGLIPLGLAIDATNLNIY